MADKVCPRCHRTFTDAAFENHYRKAHGRAPPMDPRRKGMIAVGILGVLAFGVVLAVVGGVFDDPPPDVAFHLAESPRMGRDDAPVKLVAFESPQCPACKLFHVPRGGPSTLDSIITNYVNPGKVQYVEKTFFIGEPWEERGAAAQKCSWHESPTAFFNLTERLYREAQDQYFGSLPDSFLRSHAQQEGIDADAYMGCVNANRYESETERDVRDGYQAGVGGTPTFFVVAPDGTLTQIVGPQSYGTFRNAIEEALAKGAGA